VSGPTSILVFGDGRILTGNYVASFVFHRDYESGVERCFARVALARGAEFDPVSEGPAFLVYAEIPRAEYDARTVAR